MNWKLGLSRVFVVFSALVFAAVYFSWGRHGIGLALLHPDAASCAWLNANHAGGLSAELTTEHCLSSPNLMRTYGWVVVVSVWWLVSAVTLAVGATVYWVVSGFARTT